MSDTAVAPRIEARTPAERLRDGLPALLVPVLALAGLAGVADPSIWLTLTVAGLAMGMMIFVMASGLTVIFGLMDIINFGHGAFISVGAFVGFSALMRLAGWTEPESIALNLAAVLAAILLAMAATAALGWAFERVIVRPVYGAHLKQILVTMGGLIIVQQMIHVLWGPDAIHVARPQTLRGSFLLGGAVVEKYRLMAVGIGLVLFVAMRLALTRTRIGLIVRAGVEDGEMVQALGYRIGRVFLAVFMLGSALAGLGGVMWGLYEETITAQMGADLMILVFVVVIIGGLGSVEGCFIGALLVGLLSNYTAFLFPKVALVSTIGLMVAVLAWRPEGLFPVVKAR